MFGLIFLMLFVLYSSLVFLICRFSYRKLVGKRVKPINAFLISCFVAMIGIGVIFWDAIPTKYIHYRLCSDEAGLTVYQTPEDWAKMYPEEYVEVRNHAGRELKDAIRSEHQAGSELISRTELTHNFIYEFRHYKKFNYAFQNDRHEERLIFKPTGQVLLMSIDFFGKAGSGSLANDANSFADYKFWTVTGSCELISKTVGEKFLNHGRSFSVYLKIIDGWNEK